ncbi:MAG: hypothetical protein GY909_07760 [Oligoflexia bacterium]|nr:hypothetical protein [Oligoflexia bacterium]
MGRVFRLIHWQLSKKLLISLLLLFSASILAQKEDELRIVGELKKDWSYFSKTEIDKFNQELEYRERSSDYKNLLRAKAFIIKGDHDMAKYYLAKIRGQTNNLEIIKKRYSAIIEFIQGNFEKSLALMDSADFNNNDIYKQVCLLKVSNLLALNDIKRFNREYKLCRAATFEFGTFDQFWLNSLSEIKTGDILLLQGNRIENLRRVLSDSDFTIKWMKLALYINREDVIIKWLPSLPPEAYKNKKIRELVGFAYYRLGNKEKALDFIEDISTPNTENMRGNVDLQNKKYELAFGRFQLALQQKQNSLNALERSIPLSWILGQWEAGSKLLKRINNPNLDERKLLALETAFFMKKEEFEAARRLLNLLEIKFKKKLPIELELMQTYVALREGDKELSLISSSKACRQFDGLSCWIQMQMINWDNLGLTLDREEQTKDYSLFDPDKLKEKSPITPMSERIFIDQRDIEELDNFEIQIVN